MNKLPWTLLGIALEHLPEVADKFGELLANGEFDADVADKVRSILPSTSRSGELARKLKSLHLEE
jgi:hypothetical protein